MLNGDGRDCGVWNNMFHVCFGQLSVFGGQNRLLSETRKARLLSESLKVLKTRRTRRIYVFLWFFQWIRVFVRYGFSVCSAYSVLSAILTVLCLNHGRVFSHR